MRIDRLNESINNNNNLSVKKIKDNLEDRYNIKKMLEKYLAWKNFTTPRKIVINNYYVSGDSINISYELIRDRDYVRNEFKINNVKEFNEFCEDPELYISTNKYNL